MNPSEKGKAIYGGKSEDFDGKHQDNRAEKAQPNLAYKSGEFGGLAKTNPNPAYSSTKNSSIEPNFSGYMQTSMGYAQYGSKYDGFKNPNPQSPIPVVKK